MVLRAYYQCIADKKYYNSAILLWKKGTGSLVHGNLEPPIKQWATGMTATNIYNLGYQNKCEYGRFHSHENLRSNNPHKCGGFAPQHPICRQNEGGKVRRCSR